MKRRWKIFSIYLAFSILPLLAYTAVVYYQVQHMPPRFQDLPQALLRAVDRLQPDNQINLWPAAGLLSLLAALAAYRISRTTTGTLEMLIKAWSRLAQGDFSVRLPVGTGDERDKLIQSFNDTVPRIQEQFRIQNAMQVAHEVQAALMPDLATAIAEIDLAGTSIYCDETGGDYYDLILYDPERPTVFAAAIGDVSGHGIASALVMATARGLLRAMSDKPGRLAERMARLNRLLTKDLAESGHFMTLFLAEVDLERQILRWVRAGHDPAFLYDPQTRICHELGGKGMALGIDPNVPYEAHQIAFDRPGQVLFMGTDGIWEARNSRNEMFGKSRLKSIIGSNAQKSADAFKTAILREFRDFCQDQRQEDDVTLLVIKKL